MPAKTVSIEEICQILAGDGHEPLTRMAVSNFVKDGMPKAARGTYDSTACMRWYIGRLRTSVKRKETEGEDGSVLSLDKEQIRLTAAKADNEEMTAAERRGQLIPIERYEEEMARMIVAIKQSLLNLPARMSPKLDGLTGPERKALLTASVKGILGEMAASKNARSEPSRHSEIPSDTARGVLQDRPRTRRKSRAN